jgi:hypothetical protein
MNTQGKNFSGYLAGIIAVTIWIYVARILFGLEFGWELFAIIFFAPPFIILTVFAALSLRKSFRKAPAVAPTSLQKILFVVSIVLGFFLGLVSPNITDNAPERSVIVTGNVSAVYIIAILTVTLYVASLIAIIVASYIISKKVAVKA